MRCWILAVLPVSTCRGVRRDKYPRATLCRKLMYDLHGERIRILVFLSRISHCKERHGSDRLCHLTSVECLWNKCSSVHCPSQEDASSVALLQHMDIVPCLSIAENTSFPLSIVEKHELNKWLTEA